MAKQVIQDKIWQERFHAADKYYDKWAHLFQCDNLEKYYEGFQWRNANDNTAEKPYTINKIFETIQIKIDSLIPQFPKFLISPTPGSADFDQETAALSAQLKEDVLNTTIWDQREHFHDEVEQVYKDHFFRFGIMEVGYSSDWIQNPNAARPLLSKETDANASRPYKIRSEPEVLPVNERIYFKHISAKRFRIGGVDHKYLEHCGWCGYFEWISKDDLLSLKNVMNRDKIESAGATTPDAGAFSSRNDKEGSYGEELVKIWHVWHNASKLRLIILDSPTTTIYQRKFNRIPLIDYRPDRRVSNEGFYPIPPVFHWISPQNEINETREQLRAHRRRFVRKFQVIEGAVDDVEIEKFETGPDGALIKVKRENAITPVMNADLGAASDKAIVLSSDDLNQISGTSAEVRGVADRTTATQANIISQRSSVRENADRDKIARMLSRTGREALLIIREKFILGIWAKLTIDNQETFATEMQMNQKAYHLVTTEDLNDGYDFHIIVDISSLSVSSLEDEKKKFFEFVAFISQYPAVAMSPVLIREAAYKIGYRNEKQIREMQRMALLQQLGMMHQIAGAQGGNAAQTQVQQQTPPNMEQIRQQIQGQLQ